MKKLIFEKKREAIEKGAACSWSACYQLSIGPAQRDNREDLEILGRRCRDPSNLKHATNRGARYHVLRKSHHARSRLDSTLEEEFGLTVGDHLTHG